MKRLAYLQIAVLFFLFASTVAAQGVRFSATVTQQGTIGTATNAVVLPASPSIAFCNHPANAVPCTNKATTYTDQTLATPCAGATQIVRDGTNTCVASPDAQNNWGVWVAPNTLGYDYTIVLAGGVNLGPFNVLSQTTTHNQPESFSNTATFTGALNAVAFNSIRIANASVVGADCVAKLNTLDAALGSASGEIDIDPSCGAVSTTALVESGPRYYRFIGGSTTTYSFPLGTLIFTQPTVWDCGTRQQSLMTFTGASGIAYFVNWATTSTGDYRDWGYGIRNCRTYGPGGQNGGGGNAGTGVQIGDSTHAPIGVMIYNSQWNGFTIGRTWGTATGAWGLKTDHSNWLNNTQDSVFSNTTGAGAENVEDDHAVFGSFSIGMVANDIQISGTQQFDWKCIACSFDGAQINVSNPAASIFLDSPHHENPASLSGGGNTNDYLIQSNGIVAEKSPAYLQDASSGSVPSEFVTLSGGTYAADDINVFSNKAITQAYNISGAVNVKLLGWEGGSNISADLSGSTTGRFMNCMSLGLGCRIAPGSGGSITLDATLQSSSGQIPFNSTPVPSTAGAKDLGAAALPWSNLWLGTAATNNFKFQPAATTGARIITIADPLSPTTVGMPLTIASGTSALTTALIAGGACGTTVTTAATGALTTDIISVSHNVAVTAANGGILILNWWPTAGNVNFNYCNPGAGNVTPTAMTVNWTVVR